jgi:hypothetical protein
MQCISQAQAIQAAVVRGAHAAEVEALRHTANAHFESYLDQMTEAAAHVRNIIEP